MAHKRWYALLSCQFENNFFNILAIPLSSISTSKDEFERLGSSRPLVVSQDRWHQIPLQAIYIKKIARAQTRIQERREDGFLIRRLPNEKHGYSLTEVYPPDSWNATRRIISTYSEDEGLLSMRAFMLFKNASTNDLIIMLEYTPPRPESESSKALCHVALKTDDRSLEQLHKEYCTVEFHNSLYFGQAKGVAISMIKQMVMGIEMFVIDIDIIGGSRWS
jgi:hypothetical protein